MDIFVTYLTTYNGSLLPKFYIGSSSEKKVMSGKYFGSIRSKKWYDIFQSELKYNRHKFSIEILSYHDTRKNAIKEELRLQILNDVVKSDNYFNESFAVPNGFYGRDVSGSNNPMFGKKRLDSSIRMKGNNNIAKLSDVKDKLKESKKNYIPWILGKHHSDETKDKIRKFRTGQLSKDEIERRSIILNSIILNVEVTKKEIISLFNINVSYNKISHTINNLKNINKIKNIGTKFKQIWCLV